MGCIIRSVNVHLKHPLYFREDEMTPSSDILQQYPRACSVLVRLERVRNFTGTILEGFHVNPLSSTAFKNLHLNTVISICLLRHYYFLGEIEKKLAGLVKEILG